MFDFWTVNHICHGPAEATNIDMQQVANLSILKYSMCFSNIIPVHRQNFAVAKLVGYYDFCLFHTLPHSLVRSTIKIYEKLHLWFTICLPRSRQLSSSFEQDFTGDTVQGLDICIMAGKLDEWISMCYYNIEVSILHSYMSVQ
jgi:hypothetical protein